MIWKAKTERALKLFQEYNARGGFKVARTTEESVLFVNESCDLTDEDTYRETFEFGFWVDFDEMIPLRQTRRD